MQIDEAMNRFRLASRELFNQFFRSSIPYSDESWLSERRFREVEAVLFRKLVTESVSIDYAEYGNPQPDIWVVLRNAEFAPTMLNRDTDSPYWDHELDQITRDARLVFLSFFDWDLLDYRDNRYVRIIIKNWPSHPEAVGKHALIESHYVNFVTRRLVMGDDG